ncbi:hypothetical protein [Labrys sp. KB_33_2]|uniref:hypothetical protein n=1 Tax=Labrys sp. KB_33_2 TaxID=3237479 RepID=UPI003F8DEFE4
MATVVQLVVDVLRREVTFLPRKDHLHDQHARARASQTLFLKEAAQFPIVEPAQLAVVLIRVAGHLESDRKKFGFRSEATWRELIVQSVLFIRHEAVAMIGLAIQDRQQTGPTNALFAAHGDIDAGLMENCSAVRSAGARSVCPVVAILSSKLASVAAGLISPALKDSTCSQSSAKPTFRACARQRSLNAAAPQT